MSVIVRFAPSPTGYLHIGGARTALFNYLFAKHHGGKFLLRIEDTDEKRSTKEAIDAILQGLDWLGLKHDDNFILQSKNLARHKEVAQKMLENDKAYLCYTPVEELEEMRDKAEKKGEVFRFISPWRNRIMSQNSTVKPVIRIKALLEGKTVIRDLVQGEIHVKNSELDDLVMLRSDGTPTYMLAVVVDDHDMKITHIIRGDDHLTNAFRQKIIYEAMNWNVPEFAHIPLIHGSDGTKMSKRHGATSVIDYRKVGYLPEAMRNYLLRLGWSHGDAELISDEQAILWFDLNHVGKSPSRFDFVKLDSINKHYLAEKNEVDLLKLLEACGAWSVELESLSDGDKNSILKALKFLKTGAHTLDEILARVNIYRDITVKFDDETKKLLNDQKSLIDKLHQALSALNNWSYDEIKNTLNNFAISQGLKIKDFGPILRIILTFSSASSGGIFDVIFALEKNKVLKRIESALQQLLFYN